MWLAICILSLRASIPTGFMPSADALRDGKFEMTICLGSGGMRTVQVDALGNLAQAPHDGGQDDSSLHLELCPFGAMGSAMAFPAAPPAWAGDVGVARADVLVPREQALPPLPAHGPPLGAQAPPAHHPA